MGGGFAFLIGTYYSILYIGYGMIDGTWFPLGNAILGTLFLLWSFALLENDGGEE